MESSRQWKRRAQVVVGKGGKGILIEDLRIEFEVVKTIDPAPNTAVIKIFNLHPSNEARIKNEFDDVLLNCGYEDAMRLVFRGNIKHVYRYRDGNDYITEIEAADGDKDFRHAVMNETLAAGTTNKQLVERASGTFSGGTKQGFVDVPHKARLRGKVISGNTRDVLHEIAKDSGANWSIQDGQLVIVKASSVMPGEAIVIRADTGMLGAPEINDKGIAVKCLLNPQIRINGAIKLDNNGIKAKKAKDKKTEKTNERIVDDPYSPGGDTVRLDPDGIYKCIKLTHKGINRGKGNDWTTEALCIAIDDTAPAKKKKK